VHALSFKSRIRRRYKTRTAHVSDIIKCVLVEICPLRGIFSLENKLSVSASTLLRKEMASVASSGISKLCYRMDRSVRHTMNGQRLCRADRTAQTNGPSDFFAKRVCYVASCEQAWCNRTTSQSFRRFLVCLQKKIYFDSMLV
jgi:hypothetical protein